MVEKDLALSFISAASYLADLQLRMFGPVTRLASSYTDLWNDHNFFNAAYCWNGKSRFVQQKQDKNIYIFGWDNVGTITIAVKKSKILT